MNDIRVLLNFVYLRRSACIKKQTVSDNLPLYTSYIAMMVTSQLCRFPGPRILSLSICSRHEPKEPLRTLRSIEKSVTQDIHNAVRESCNISPFAVDLWSKLGVRNSKHRTVMHQRAMGSFDMLVTPPSLIKHYQSHTNRDKVI